MARRCSTICLPVGKDAYKGFIDDSGRFRAWLDGAFRDCPELFPESFAGGYRLEDDRTSAKTGIRLRRIRLKSTGESFSVRPFFVVPYHSGFADDAQGPLSLRAFGVPFWALARVFGKIPIYWYRLEVGLGRNSVVGTTIRQAGLPEHLLATNTTRRAMAPRTTSPPRWAMAAAWGLPWPRVPVPKTSRRPMPPSNGRPRTPSPTTGPRV